MVLPQVATAVALNLGVDDGQLTNAGWSPYFLDSSAQTTTQAAMTHFTSLASSLHRVSPVSHMPTTNYSSMSLPFFSLLSVLFTVSRYRYPGGRWRDDSQNKAFHKAQDLKLSEDDAMRIRPTIPRLPLALFLRAESFDRSLFLDCTCRFFFLQINISNRRQMEKLQENLKWKKATLMERMVSCSWKRSFFFRWKTSVHVVVISTSAEHRFSGATLSIFCRWLSPDIVIIPSRYICYFLSSNDEQLCFQLVLTHSLKQISWKKKLELNIHIIQN